MLLLREDPRQLEPREPAALLLCALRTVTEPPSSVAGPAAETTETASLKRPRWVGLHRANSELKNHTAHCTAATGSIWKGDCVSQRKALRGRESQLHCPIHAQSCWCWRCPSSGP